MQEGIRGALRVTLTCLTMRSPDGGLPRTRPCSLFYTNYEMAKVHLERMKYVLELGKKNPKCARSRLIQGMGGKSKGTARYGLRRKSQNP